MAEETVAAAAPAPAEVVAVVTEVPVVETKEKDLPVAPPAEEKSTTDDVIEKPKEEESTTTTATTETKQNTPIDQSVSFKEESNIVADLEDPEKKALDELKALIQEALNKNEFATLPPPPPPPAPKEEEKPAEVAAPEAETPAAPVVPTTTETKETKPAEVVVAPEPTTETPPPPPAAVEQVKKEIKEEVKEEVKEETPAPVPAPVAVVAAVTVVEEDGTRTVEAIEETIVAVTKEEPTPAEPVAETKEEEPVPVVEEETVVPGSPIAPEEVSIFGIPLLADERSDVILLKFLRARDFKVKDAFTMIRNTVRWRKEFGIDELLEEDLGTDLEKVVFMSGFDKEGHPVCYNAYGEFQNKELYQKIFSDVENSQKFIRWRIQFLEKSIRKLNFTPGGISTIVQVNDLKNSPGPFKRELRIHTNQAVSLLQDNYPEFVAKQVFINVPWWYLTFNRMISPFLTLRTKSKFVFAGTSKSAETLFKYVSPEQVPVQYGGLSIESEEFSTADAVTEVIVKPATKQTVEFPVSESSTFVWELRVVGWDVSYGAEFVPTAEDGYTVIVAKTRKIAPTDEPVILNSFKIGEPGKIVLTVNNSSSKKKKLLYRSKTKTSSDQV